MIGYYADIRQGRIRHSALGPQHPAVGLAAALHFIDMKSNATRSTMPTRSTLCQPTTGAGSGANLFIAAIAAICSMPRAAKMHKPERYLEALSVESLPSQASPQPSLGGWREWKPTAMVQNPESTK